jgi:hypothetical protein
LNLRVELGNEAGAMGRRVAARLRVRRGVIERADGAVLAVMREATGRWRDPERGEHRTVDVIPAEGGLIQLTLRRADGSGWTIGLTGSVALVGRELVVGGGNMVAARDPGMGEWRFGPGAARFDAVELEWVTGRVGRRLPAIRRHRVSSTR